jgi:hypothetical protein
VTALFLVAAKGYCGVARRLIGVPRASALLWYQIKSNQTKALRSLAFECAAWFLVVAVTLAIFERHTSARVCVECLAFIHMGTVNSGMWWDRCCSHSWRRVAADGGANVNATNHTGRTALQNAESWGRMDMCALLRACGATA